MPYLWDCETGLPESIPTLTDEELNAVWSTLVALFATGDPKIARQKRDVAALDIGPTTDSLAEWLVSNWEVYDQGRDGELYLRCPFADGHSTDSGETSTAYFIAGSGGYERGHWVCLHGSCTGRTDHDFTEKAGYLGSGFTALPVRTPAPVIMPPIGAARAALSRYMLPEIDVSDIEMPSLTRDKKGTIDNTADNINKLLMRPDITRTRLALDLFKEELVWCHAGEAPGDEQWQRFTDADYVRIKITLERLGLKAIGKETIRDCVDFVARQHEFDSAQEWLSRLTWDGVARISTFLPSYIGTVDSPYTRAVSRYLWTALAARVVRPGCQADMVPIFYGAQGTRKTSAIKAMAPNTETYTDIDLTARDDTYRGACAAGWSANWKNCGACVAVTRKRSRRGSRGRTKTGFRSSRSSRRSFRGAWCCSARPTNRRSSADDSGERRWLPAEVATHGPIRVEAIRADVLQLWAEAAVMERVTGVAWEDAERLARDVHVDFKIDDPGSRSWSGGLRSRMRGSA